MSIPLAIELHKQGLDVISIAEELKVTVGRIYQIFRKHTYKLPQNNPAKQNKRLWEADEIDYLKANTHMSVVELARYLGRSTSAVHQKLRTLGKHVEVFCVVCGARLSQRGKFCRKCEWIGRRISCSKYKMKEKGLTFELTDSQVIAIVKDKCHYCGKSGGGIDRIDSSKGYIINNVVPCCQRCNEMKMDESVDAWLSKMKLIIANMEKSNE